MPDYLGNLDIQECPVMRANALSNLIRIALLLVLTASPQTMIGQARPYTPAEAGAIGRAVVDQLTRQYGLVSNPTWNRDVASVLEKLRGSSGYPGLQIRYTVVGNAEVNAQAVPGGSLVLNAGMMQFLSKLARSSNKTPQAQSAQFTAYLAAVLSHELAHITLGHTDSLTLRIVELANARGVPDSVRADELSYRALLQDSSSGFERLAHSRERELAADRAGALYLLRAGWTIQT